MDKVKQNGAVFSDSSSLTIDMTPNKRALSPAQQKYLQRLVSILGRAEAAQDAAQEALQIAQGNAGDFVGYCAEELGIQLGTDGWRFDQASTSFIKESANAEYDTRPQ